MNHRIERLYSLLDANETQFNGASLSEIPFDNENAINADSDSSCSSNINLRQFSVPKSKTNFSFKKQASEKCSTKFSNSTYLNIHKRIHSKEKRFACGQCPKTLIIRVIFHVTKYYIQARNRMRVNYVQKNFHNYNI
jgi:hypothetical protein